MKNHSELSLPLLDLSAPDAPLFLQRGGAISRGQFAAAVTALAQRLPQHSHVLNLCENRHTFSRVFAAAALRGQAALLPPGSASGMLQALARRYPDAIRLGDDPAQSELPLDLPGEAALDQLPHIPAAQTVAVAFTSGSTGEPQPQLKTFHALQHVGAALSRRFFAGSGRCSIVATVPPQHMYGLEASILLPLAGGHSVWAGRPVFPDDVRAALAEVPAPRVLVTTPVHIRALLAAGVKLPPLHCIVSATAPLPQELAEGAEQAYGAPVLEIYGCSEAGTVATRRSTGDGLWQPIDGVRLEQREELTVVHGVHLPQPVPLQDLLQPEGEGFRLLGRTSDMLKVAGKRASLADLTQKLLSIPGVVDGVVFQPDSRDHVVQRPAALVVAPGLSESEILSALGRLVDPVFLPRPLRKIDGLPRNPVGKLPRSSLQRLLARAS
jgi:acyl-coenzyme A synthetase/AMP-(fatty) acid ligase